MIGELFFGRMFGFMEKSCDHGSYIEALDTFLPFITRMTMTPKFYRPLFQLSALFSSATRKASKTMPRIAQAAKDCVADRIKLEAEHGGVRTDLLQHLLGILESKGTKVDFGMGEVEISALTALYVWAASLPQSRD